MILIKPNLGLYMSYSLIDLLNGGYIGNSRGGIIGVLKGDTCSSDCSSYGFRVLIATTPLHPNSG